MSSTHVAVTDSLIIDVDDLDAVYYKAGIQFLINGRKIKFGINQLIREPEHLREFYKFFIKETSLLEEGDFSSVSYKGHKSLAHRFCDEELDDSKDEELQQSPGVEEGAISLSKGDDDEEGI